MLLLFIGLSRFKCHTILITFQFFSLFIAFSPLRCFFSLRFIHFVILDEPKRDAKILKKYWNLLCLEMVIYLFFILWLFIHFDLFVVAIALAELHFDVASWPTHQMDIVHCGTQPWCVSTWQIANNWSFFSIRWLMLLPWLSNHSMWLHPKLSIKKEEFFGMFARRNDDDDAEIGPTETLFLYIKRNPIWMYCVRYGVARVFLFGRWFWVRMVSGFDSF